MVKCMDMHYSSTGMLFQYYAIRQNYLDHTPVQGQRKFLQVEVLYVGIGPENNGPSIQRL